MIDYYLRCKASNRARLLALGERLGAITVLRTPRPDDLPGEVEVVQATGGGCFLEIGAIPDERTGDLVESALYPGVMVRVGVKPRSEDGEPLWHANLRTPINLRQRAMEMAAADPTIAAELAQLRRYFVTRPGQPDAAAAPQSPARVFA